MFYFSKSKYVSHCNCKKITWLRKYKPEVEKDNPSKDSIIKEGTEVGKLARGLFGKYVDVTTMDADGKLNLNEMIKKTKECLDQKVDNICEASFHYDGCYCAVDLLKRNQESYDIYEVKSSTEKKEHYIVDISYQRYVLEKCGISIRNAYLVIINSQYERNGDLDLKQLFKILDVTDEVHEALKDVPTNLDSAKEILSLKDEPKVEFSTSCHDNNDCPFREYCFRNIPKPSIFDLYRIPFSKALKNYQDGIITYQDVIESKLKLNDICQKQINHTLNILPDEIDLKGVTAFLDNLSYPLYFLDFETTKSAIPPFDKTKPNMQIPFQYSLHYIESENGKLKHKEFLAESGTDPRRAIAESLVKNIPQDVCVLAYNKSFECNRLRELAVLFPDLALHLLHIEVHIQDLLIPFQKGYYYTKAMGKSFSIKSVLPALFPNDPELDYHNLEGVHNGSEAMNIFPQIATMKEEDKEITRRNLLKYCELDTYAMVKVWQKLVETVKQNQSD